MDAIHFHVRSEGRIIKKAVYVTIGINMEGFRDALSMWFGENGSVKFWVSVMNDMRNRGTEDILIACVDGLTGFPSYDGCYKKMNTELTRLGKIHSQLETFFEDRLGYNI